MTTRVLIVDDHSVVRQGLSTFLKLDPEIEIAGVAVDGVEALQLAEELRPDVVLMDLQMPEMDGYEATRQLRQQHPDMQVLVLTSSLDHEAIRRALQAGACGYLLKNMEGDALCRAIKSASAGQVLLAPQAASLFVATTPPPPPEPARNNPPAMVATRATGELLTPRESEVLGGLAQGLTNKEIAYQLGLSEKTVKIHVSIIMAKLNAQSRTQAALQATRLGLVPPQGTEPGTASI